MEIRKRGKQSFELENQPVILSWASIAGKKESEGPLGAHYDITQIDSYFGKSTWEQAEIYMQELALKTIATKAKMRTDQFNVIFSGDLLNQCIGSSYALRNLKIPHLGLYGACSTMAESLLMSAMTVNAGYFENAIAMTSSHFASTERQYRFPLGYGGQRTPTAQWTVTGTGAVLVASSGNGPKITSCTIGTVVDLGIKDTNNMGAAMAPAAYQTIKSHFSDLGTNIESYDLIVTGDLGQLGKDILLTLAQKDGFEIGGKLCDCGTMVFDLLKQDVHCGGSGCGCSAIVLCSHFLEQLSAKRIKKILFCGTGALLSPTSAQQGLSIPGICHAVTIVGG